MNAEIERVLGRLRAGDQTVEGLLTIRTHEGRIWSLASPGASIAEVRRALLDLGLPDHLLDVYSAEEVLIPWPTDDAMLIRGLPEGRPPQDPSDAPDE